MPTYLPRLIFLLCIPILFAGGYFSIRQTPPLNSTITVEAAPSSYKVTIDGKKASPGDNKVTAGQHTITVKKDGFSQQAQTVITAIGQTVYTGFVLVSNSASTKNWYNDHPDDQQLSESISSHSSDYNSELSTQKNTLLQELPVLYGDGRGGLIRIDSGVPIFGSSQPAIYVNAQSPSDRQGVLTWMRSNGYNPANMDIVFYGLSASYAPQQQEGE